MKIGIISDTHDHVQNIEKAVAFFKQEKVEKVIHLGDFVAPFTLRLYKGLAMTGIFGNNDGDKYRLMKMAQSAGIHLEGNFYAFEQDGLKIAAYHGTEPELKIALLESGLYDVVLCGHTHQVERQTIGKTLVLNPGTANGFGEKGTVMIFDTKTKNAEVIKL